MTTKQRTEPEPTPAEVAPAETGPAPEHVGRGRTLVRTRPGYAFQGTTVDVPITSTGVYVSKTEADEIVAEAAAHDEIVYIDENPEG